MVDDEHKFVVPVLLDIVGVTHCATTSLGNKKRLIAISQRVDLSNRCRCILVFYEKICPKGIETKLSITTYLPN